MDSAAHTQSAQSAEPAKPAPEAKPISKKEVIVTEAAAQTIWKQRDHVNLTGHHLHNYRVGHGKVNEWKMTLTNHHRGDGSDLNPDLGALVEALERRELTGRRYS